MIRLSIIIVSYNVKFYVQQCIEAIRNSSSDNFEIIIIDNNSTDGSADFLARKYKDSIHLIRNVKNLGFGKACNQGLKIGTGEYTLFLNPDTIIDRQTVQNCLAFAEKTENLGLLGVRMINEKGAFLAESKRAVPSPKVSFFRLTGLHSILGNSKTANEYYAPHLGELDIGKVDVISGAFMFAETDKLKQLGGFDEDYFMYGEDVDLSYRSLNAGFYNYYLGSETIVHHKGKSTDKTNFDYVNRFYGAMSIFHKKHVKDSYSWLFNVLISLAILSRKFLNGFALIIKNSILPIIDFSLFVGGGLFIKYLWSKYYFENVNYYQDSGAVINLILYSLIFVAVLLFGSSYRYYKKRSIAIIQLVIGLTLILVMYSILPVEWRSSRALIGFYFLWNAIVLILTRTVYSAFTKHDFNLGQQVGVVAAPAMLDHILKSDVKQNVDTRTFYPIRPAETFSDERYIGDFENIIQLSSDNSLDSILVSVDEFELIEVTTNIETLQEYGIPTTIVDHFDIENVLSENVKHKDLLDSKTLDFKILFWENKWIKRSFDVVFSLVLIPISIFHSKLKLSDLIDVIRNGKSLIGYQIEDNSFHKLPQLKTGVIPVSRKRRLLKDVHIENLDYALHYSIFTDFKHLVSFLV